jgi:thiamine biosynthesis protein ThiI
MKYIIKISPEITIKSKPVRKQCLLMLKNNIKKHFDFNEIKASISWNWDRINIEWDDDRISKVLTCISWIAYFMEVESFLLPENEEEIFDFIFEKAKDFYLDKLENKTFVSRVKRSWNHNFSSIDLERYIWWGLLKFAKNAKVIMKDPDITVKIEVKDKKFHIIKYRIEWIGGYPIWFQDKVLSLISGWFDSWVSTYSMMKRGCEVDYLFFNLWGSAHELWVKQVSYYLWKTFSIPHKKARFITVNFEEVIAELLTKVNHRFRWILLKRFMLKVASIISENHYFALVKWDSLWQVSSQTLKNMYVIDKASTNLVLRPLIADNKQEIIDISKQIWTYNFACNMPEYCWVISDKPATWASLEDILAEEENILEEVLTRAIEWRKTEFVKEMMDQYKWKEATEIEVVFLPWDNEVVIDIREEADKKKNPLVLENTEVLEIPFFEINHKFKDLDNTKTYLLYCDKWVLSNLHWLYLKDLGAAWPWKGFKNIKVLRLIKWESNCKL